MSFVGTRAITEDALLASRAAGNIDKAAPDELRALVRELLGAMRETRAVLTKAGFPPDPRRLWLLVEQAEDAVAALSAKQADAAHAP